MRKPVVALAASAGVFTVVAAGAASLSVVGFVPQFGNVNAACQQNGVTVTPNVEAVNVPYYNEGTGQYQDEVYQSVTSVTVSGISEACNGQELAVSISLDNAQHYVANRAATIAVVNNDPQGTDFGSVTIDFDPTLSTSGSYYPDMYVKYITDIDVTIAGNVVAGQAPLV